MFQELTTFIQQSPVDFVPMNIEQKLPTNTSRTGNTAVKSTINSNNNATIRKPSQQQMTNDERMFFGRPTTIGQGQYHNRTGLMSGNKQHTMAVQQQQQQQQQQHQQQQQQQQHHQQQQQRRPISWFQYVVD